LSCDRSPESSIIIGFLSKISNGEATASPKKISSQPSQPGVRESTTSVLVSSSLVTLPLLQRLEEQCVILFKLSQQYTETVSLLYSFQSKHETGILICNATTLFTQLDITLSVAAAYKSRYPAFHNMSSKLSVKDRAILITTLCDSCSQLWGILSVPLPKQIRNTIIKFITGVDLFLTEFFSSSL
jgi:hypothetical protein